MGRSGANFAECKTRMNAVGTLSRWRRASLVSTFGLLLQIVLLTPLLPLANAIDACEHGEVNPHQSDRRSVVPGEAEDDGADNHRQERTKCHPLPYTLGADVSRDHLALQLAPMGTLPFELAEKPP